METVEELFGNLNKIKKEEKCLAAMRQKNPLPCQKVHLVGVDYCKIHNTIFLKP